MIHSLWKMMGLAAILLVCLFLDPAGAAANGPGEAPVTALSSTRFEIGQSQSAPETTLTTGPGDGDNRSQFLNSMASLPLLGETSDLNNQVIVIYQAANPDNFRGLQLTANAVKAGKSVSDRVDVFEISDGIDVDTLIETLSESDAVLAAGRNKKIEPAVLPDDPDIINGYAWQFAEVGCETTWNTVANTTPVVVAVIDSGLNVNHPDLIGRTVSGYDYLTNSTEMVDLTGHGTWVSGCIAATANNHTGIAGVAGLADIRISPYRVGNEHYDLGNICAAVMAAADRPDVRVINMSYRSYGYENTEAAAIQYAAAQGKILVASAGNEGNDPYYAGSYAYPASFDAVISVGATTTSHVIADFSQYNDRVDLCAPGKDVYSTSPDGGYDPYYGYGLLQLDQALSGLDPDHPQTDISCDYQGHIQNIGWQDWKSNGETCGTSGQALRMEGLRIKTVARDYDLGIGYQSHIQDIGWQTTRYDGELSGTMGQSLRLEAVRMALTEADAEQFDIYYRVHAQNIGWMDWAKNGASSGTAGFGYRLEAIEIRILAKGSAPPGDTAVPFVQKN